MSCAGKTGTTNDKKDGWFCGFTPYYTTTVWIGYDSPRTMNDLYGSTYPLTVWRTFMEEIHAGLENKPFPEYQSSSKSDYNNDDNNDYVPDPTVEPDAVGETIKPKATKKPKDTQAPIVTPEPTKVPVAEPTQAPDDVPVEDVPDDNPDDGDDIEDIPDTMGE